MIVTELAVIEVTPEGLVLREVAPGVTPEAVQKVTEAKLRVAEDLKDISIVRLSEEHPDQCGGTNGLAQGKMPAGVTRCPDEMVQSSRKRGKHAVGAGSKSKLTKTKRSSWQLKKVG